MGQYLTVGSVAHETVPYVWKPKIERPRFVMVQTEPTSHTLDTMAVPTPEEEKSLSLDAAEDTVGAVGAPVEEEIGSVQDAPEGLPGSSEKDEEVLVSTLPIVGNISPAPSATDKIVKARRPLSQNLAAIRRTLNLTTEEFARPILEGSDGAALITRLESGYSRPSDDVADMIVTPWTICRDYLYTGNGPMFEHNATTNPAKHVIMLERLLRTYLNVATFDREGNQYWKGSLVDDLMKLIEVEELDGCGVSRVVRLIYDYLDADQFVELLDRFGR